ncbi:unnamed protein product [Caenorhabditis angaria]|uniref:Uncharacterized protein n=1 Tax=Caenorhabditis angaria TaxID=860376 RepID=A0A9P1N460_9PELO|nr:unnamed protein product [Caenorhabditis angaria]
MLADRRIRKNLPVFIGLSVLLLFIFGYLYTSSFDSSHIGTSIDDEQSQSQSENEENSLQQNREDLQNPPYDETLSKDPRIRQRNREETANAESFYDEKLREKQEADRLSGNGFYFRFLSTLTLLSFAIFMLKNVLDKAELERNADVVEEDIDPLNNAAKPTKSWNSTLISQNVVGGSEAAKTWFRSRLPSRRYQKLLGDVESSPKSLGQPEHLELSEQHVLRRSKRYETLLTR